MAAGTLQCLLGSSSPGLLGPASHSKAFLMRWRDCAGGKRSRPVISGGSRLREQEMIQRRLWFGGGRETAPGDGDPNPQGGRGGTKPRGGREGGEHLCLKALEALEDIGGVRLDHRHLREAPFPVVPEPRGEEAVLDKHGVRALGRHEAPGVLAGEEPAQTRPPRGEARRFGGPQRPVVEGKVLGDGRGELGLGGLPPDSRGGGEDGPPSALCCLCRVVLVIQRVSGGPAASTLEAEKWMNRSGAAWTGGSNGPDDALPRDFQPCPFLVRLPAKRKGPSPSPPPPFSSSPSPFLASAAPLVSPSRFLNGCGEGSSP